MDNEAKQKIHDILGEFDDAMLVTHDPKGYAHARPMRIAACNEDRLDDVWFVTGVDSGKIDEIRREPRVAVTMADGSHYLSLTGHARVVRDAAKIKELWKDSWSIWFPDGPSSEDIALIQVRPIFGEYWDQSLPQGLSFAVEAAKAWMKDEKIDIPDGPEHHGRVLYG